MLASARNKDSVCSLVSFGKSSVSLLFLVSSFHWLWGQCLLWVFSRRHLPVGSPWWHSQCLITLSSVTNSGCHWWFDGLHCYWKHSQQRRTNSNTHLSSLQLRLWILVLFPTIWQHAPLAPDVQWYHPLGQQHSRRDRMEVCRVFEWTLSFHYHNWGTGFCCWEDRSA